MLNPQVVAFAKTLTMLMFSVETIIFGPMGGAVRLLTV